MSLYHQLNIHLKPELRQRIFSEAERRKLSIRALFEAGLDALSVIDQIRLDAIDIDLEGKRSE